MVADALSRKIQSLHAISMVTPKWIHKMEQSYHHDEQCKSLFTKLLLDPARKPNYIVKYSIIY
jgi:hypothetical protein